MSNRLALITRMEFRLTAANRAFIILTVLGPFFIAAISVLPGFFTARAGANPPEISVGIVNADSRFLELMKPALGSAGIRALPYRGTPRDLEGEVLSGRLEGYLVIPADFPYAPRLEYVSGSGADPRVLGIIQGVVSQSVVRSRLENAGFSASEVETLARPPEMENRRLSGKSRSGDFLAVLMTGLTLVMLLYFTVLLYGQATGRSVLAEKTSKTVEIMLSSVKPLDLLYGKIFGKALAALLQYAVWVLMALAFLALFGPRLGMSLGSAHSSGAGMGTGLGAGLGIGPAALAFLVLFFLLAYFLYSGIYAALGSASQDEQHLNQLAWPVIAFLVLPVLLISPILTNPSAPFAVVLSLFPLTAPVVMFLRVTLGGAPAWQVLLSIGLQLVSIAGVIYLSAKIFRVGILMTGKRFKLGEIMKWIAR